MNPQEPPDTTFAIPRRKLLLEDFLTSPFGPTSGLGADDAILIDAVYRPLATQVTEITTLFPEPPQFTPLPSAPTWLEMQWQGGGQIGWLCRVLGERTEEAQLTIDAFIQLPDDLINNAASVVLHLDAIGRIRADLVKVESQIQDSENAFSPPLFALALPRDGRAIAVQPVGEHHRVLVLTTSNEERVN